MDTLLDRTRAVELTLGGRLYQTDSGGINDLSGAVVTALRLETDVPDAADVREKGFNLIEQTAHILMICNFAGTGQWSQRSCNDSH